MAHIVQRLFIFKFSFSFLKRTILLFLLWQIPCYGVDKQNLKNQGNTQLQKNSILNPQISSDPIKNEESLENYLLRRNKEISYWFDSQAEGIDLFLVGKKLTTAKNKTSFRIENISIVKQSENFNNTTSFKMQLRLPNLEKYWQLQLTSYDEIQEKRGANKNFVSQSPREKNYGATIGWFQNLGKVRTSFQPRIELQNPLKVSHSFTFESILDLKNVTINPKIELYAHPDKGLGFFNAYNFDFPINTFFSLVWINEANYLEKTHVLGVTHGLSLGQIITAKKSLAYNLFSDFSNRPNYHLTGYNLSVSWSETLYKKVLDYRLTPFLEFTEVKGFVGVPGLNFQIFLNF